MVWQIESDVVWVLFLATAAMEIFAFVDALVRPTRAYVAADKLTKPAWLLILGLALLTCLVFRSPTGIFAVIGIVAAGVYLADVRPALNEVTRR